MMITCQNVPSKHINGHFWGHLVPVLVTFLLTGHLAPCVGDVFAEGSLGRRVGDIFADWFFGAPCC